MRNLNEQPGHEFQQPAEERYESMHGTNDYITSWDAIFSEPMDVFANGYDLFLDQNYLNASKEYPNSI